MNTKIIAVINQKGGCGKTTIAVNLAGTLNLRHSKKVVLIDGDSQASATKWTNKADENEGFPCTVFSLAKAGGFAHREIKKLIGGYDFIIIDCPPNTEAQFNASVLLVADLAIIPFNPSPVDMEAIEEFKPLLEVAFVNNPKLRAHGLANRTDNRSISSAVIKHFKADQPIELLRTSIKSRAIYCETELTGSTVYTSRVSQAKNEISLLTDEILDIINTPAVEE